MESERYGHMVVTDWKRIIYRMLELAKRWGPYFLGAFAVLAVGGCAPLYYLNGKSYQLPLSITLWTLSFICLIIATIAFVYDVKDARRKDKKEEASKHPKVRFLC